MPASTFVRVDLPAPLSPTRAVISPVRRVRSMPPRAVIPPKCLLMPSHTTTGSPAVSAAAPPPVPAMRGPCTSSSATELHPREPVAELLLGVEAGIDDRVHVRRVDALDVEIRGGDLLGVVVELPVDQIALGLVPGQRRDDELGRSPPFDRVVLEDRGRLLPLEDEAECVEVGVLAAVHGDLTGEPLTLESRDGTAGRPVVHRHDGVHLVLGPGEALLHQLLRLGGLPTWRVVLTHHLDLPGVDERLQDLVLPLLVAVGVVVAAVALQSGEPDRDRKSVV